MVRRVSVWRNLLPQDTRVVELASAGALLLGSATLWVATWGGATALPPVMAALHPPVFWALVAGCLGLLQGLALLAYPWMEVLRCAMALVCGTAWLWLGLGALHGGWSPGPGAMWALGWANLYGFSVSFLYLRKAWAT